ncbi:MAG: hypothetical protein EOO43_19520 [Flavobacterium sp.]|nr:MAG: hypothetical protein EOO43_19520 [Flavobacterium sp.]
MKLIITFGLISSHCFAFGQIKLPTKQEVEKVIKLAISQKMTDKNISCSYGQCGEWWTANSDSIFYKSDIIKFYNSSNIVYSNPTFCTSVVWDFDKKDVFYSSEANMCQEPPTRSLKAGAFLSGNDAVKIPNRYKVLLKNNQAYIVTYVDQVVYETFKVIELRKTTQSNLGDESFVLTLVRQKQS